MATLDRSFFNEIVAVSIPSIKIVPSMQARRKIAPIKELFPTINGLIVEIHKNSITHSHSVFNYLHRYVQQCQFFLLN